MPVCCVCRVLKPFIKRDTGIQPLKVKLLQEIIAYPHRYSATWLLCLMPIHTGTAPRGFCVSCLFTQVQHHVAFVSHAYPHRYSTTWLLCLISIHVSTQVQCRVALVSHACLAFVSHAYLAFVSCAYPHRYSAMWLLCPMPIHTGTVPRGFNVQSLVSFTVGCWLY